MGMPTRRKQCKAALHVQRERTSGKGVNNNVCDVPNFPTKGEELGRNDLATSQDGVTDC